MKNKDGTKEPLDEEKEENVEYLNKQKKKKTVELSRQDDFQRELLSTLSSNSVFTLPILSFF
jgi:hypothetical protein